MELYFVEYKERQIHLTTRFDGTIVFLDGKIPGSWSIASVDGKGRCLMSGSDVLPIKMLNLNEYKNTTFEDLIRVLDSQIPPHMLTNCEIWSPIKYLVHDGEDEKCVDIYNSNLIFHFDKSGKFKGIQSRIP